jgi:hypothetical protein
MRDGRRIFSDNEKLLLFNEVDGRCPLCGVNLTYKKNSNIYKSFEIAHIYPANPKANEVKVLNGLPRLDSDVNCIRNVLAVCTKCHTEFDNPRTKDEYMKWYNIKEKLLFDSDLKSTYALYNVETEIKEVLQRLNSEEAENSLVQLSYNSLKIEQKANDTLPYAIKRSVQNDVVDYFDYIKNLFIEIDKITPNKFDTLASQIKTFYLKCTQTSTDQNLLYLALVDWLNEKTESYSRRACEIVVAFFIQDCEVFS